MKSPDVADNIHRALDDAGMKKVAVNQDRAKGVVTLGANVANEGDKQRAEAIAKSMAGEQVVADQIAVVPVGAASDARTMNSDLDKGIEQAWMPRSFRVVCTNRRGGLAIQAAGDRTGRSFRSKRPAGRERAAS